MLELRHPITTTCNVSAGALRLPAKSLFVFALQREAAVFRRCCPQARIVVTGVGEANATKAIERALQSHSTELVVSAGFAGGLIDGLVVGSIVIANHVIDDKTRHEVTSNWPIGIVPARIATVANIVATPKEKALLADRIAATAADMETIAIAQACRQRGVPWVAVRVISDDANTSLSPELVALIAGGSVAPWQALRAIWRRPSLIKEMWRLARDTRLAADRLAEFLATCLEPTTARQS